jgi:alanine racemase
MNRLGFRHDNLDRTLPEVAASPNLSIDAVYTHFATADDPDHALFGEQRTRFEASLTRLAALGIDARVRHAANSAALLRDERVWYDFVRPGLLLYGVVPPPLATTIALRPALSLHSRIVAVKGIRPGEGTGYGIKTTVTEQRTIAVVPAGYADGLDLRLAGRGFMLVRGCRMPIVGSVCMDMTMIDVTGTDEAPGDEVVILGQQGDESIGVREVAASIGTIPYELLCRVGSRIQRVYT